jgi:hypothetical protein
LFLYFSSSFLPSPDSSSLFPFRLISKYHHPPPSSFPSGSPSRVDTVFCFFTSYGVAFRVRSTLLVSLLNQSINLLLLPLRFRFRSRVSSLATTSVTSSSASNTHRAHSHHPPSGILSPPGTHRTIPTLPPRSIPIHPPFHFHLSSRVPLDPSKGCSSVLHPFVTPSRTSFFHAACLFVLPIHSLDTQFTHS